MHLGGSCHCGQLVVKLDTEKSPGELVVRICGCSFCVKHRPRYTSDPSGSVHFQIKSEASLSRYRFGLQLADFLICRTCGVFVGAYGDGRAVVNLDALTRSTEFTATPTVFAAYNTETVATRNERRAKNWTPATIDVG
jgi:hypothetical protein